MAQNSQVLERELDYHERLYSGFAQRHFAKPAVRALRDHLVARILAKAGVSPQARVLSVGCGIGDTEILLARHVREVVGIDLSPTAVRQANEDAAKIGVRNFHARRCLLDDCNDGPYDAVVAIFFLHHLPDSMLESCAASVARLLRPGGVFYSLDPSSRRLSGLIGEFLFPETMAQYQTEDERPLEPESAQRFFGAPRFETQASYYDFLSTPLAGLLPDWPNAYLAARAADELLIRTPGLRELSSNFELTAIKTA